MRFSKLLLFSTIASYALGSIIPAKQEKDALDRRATKTTTTTTTKKTTSSTSKTTTTKGKTTSASSKKTTTTSTSTSKSSPSSTTSATSSSASKSSTVSSSSSSTSAVADASCTNGPLTRQCWGGGYSIATDFDDKHPTTGVTRSYTLTITNTTMAPDGNSRLVLAVNGQYPGPAIFADWGDYLSINVINKLQDNGTGIHWHGVRQLDTNTEDGVPGITECPIAPGSSHTYNFQATQFGTSWYHSHFSGQYGDGVLGPIIINGPATSNYDVDLGALPFTDWYYDTVQQESVRIANNPGPPPAADTGLINGTMVSSAGGAYFSTTITKGKKYRLRLINTSVDNHFMVSLDGHPFTVITSDFVPVKPYTADWIFLGIGQRYDVIINANQTVDNYWFRAEVQDQAGCGANSNNGNIKSIFTYTGAASGNPSSSATEYTQRCTDETQLVPYWNSFVPTGPLNSSTELDVAINIGVATSGQVVTWGINLTSLNVEWDKPILEYVLEGNTSWPQTENLIELPLASTWYYWIIQEVAGNIGNIGVPHPIHLHGHDFYILGTGTGTYNQSIDGATLQYTNPPRRDVAMLPSLGWLALAFQTDNPGAWIMHCHIAWHASEGLAVQFLETMSSIQGVDPIGSTFTDQCDAWNTYYPAKAAYLKDDSGI